MESYKKGRKKSSHDIMEVKLVKIAYRKNAILVRISDNNEISWSKREPECAT